MSTESEDEEEDENPSEAAASNKENEYVIRKKRKEKRSVTQCFKTLCLAQILILGHLIQLRNKDIDYSS